MMKAVKLKERIIIKKREWKDFYILKKYMFFTKIMNLLKIVKI